MRWLRAALLAYLIACAALLIFQRDLMYIPYRGPIEPLTAGAYGYDRQSFPAVDGVAIPYWEHRNPQSPFIILYLHGNGGGLHAFVEPLTQLSKAGYAVAAMEYRGYPGAPDAPSQHKLVADAVALYDTLRSSTGKPVVIWGYSLGSGVAMQLAAQRPAAAVVLEAPFLSAIARAQEIYSIFPAQLLLVDQYRSDTAITKVNAPIYIMHGGKDLIVPDHHGRELAALSPQASFHFYPEADHFTLADHGAYTDLFDWFKQLK